MTQTDSFTSGGGGIPNSYGVDIAFTKPITLRVLATIRPGSGSGLTEPVTSPYTSIIATDKGAPTEPSIAGMRPDPMVTSFGHATIRARDLLGYVLRMKQELTGRNAENPIFQMYSKSRQVANVLFIIVLMLIAFMYNFAILISRERLRRLLILFTVAIIGVNFSYTIATITIQGSDKLFQILLVRDESVALDGSDINSSGRVVVRGKVITEEDLLTSKNFTYSSFVGASKNDPVDTSRTEGINDMDNNRFRENIVFNLALMSAGAIAQFLIVLVLLARVMILWSLIIVAPFFFILAIFKFSQEIFKYWGWFFMRWLFIGPLMALFLSANVRIWSSVNGIPISSAYERAEINTFFPNIINIWVGAPGVREGINLETPDQVIKYMMGLMMLYLSLLLPFWLTRRILIFSPEKPSLLSRLLGSGKSKVKPEIKHVDKPVDPKTPLKGGFAFQTPKVEIKAANTTVASAGANVSARSSVATGVAASSEAGVGIGRLANTKSQSEVSTEGKAIYAAAAGRIKEAGDVQFNDLASKSKPKAVPRSMDEQVQSVARHASKSEISESELSSLNDTELSELRSNLSSLASSSILGQDSVLSKNMRSLDKEVDKRSHDSSEERGRKVKVQGLADKAQGGKLESSDLSVLKLAEMQSLKTEIESRVASNPNLKLNDILHANYDSLVKEIGAQSISSIASIQTQITPNVNNIIQSLGSGQSIAGKQFGSLSIPELKETSLAIHRMERALRDQATMTIIHDNISTLREAKEGREPGQLNANNVDAVLSKAVSQKLQVADFSGLSGSDVDAMAAELAAIESLGSKMHTNVTVDANSPTFKESVVAIASEIATREKAIGGSSQDGANGSDGDSTSGKSHPELVQKLLKRILAEGTLKSADLVSLSMNDLKSLKRMSAVVGDNGPDQPSGPLSGDALVAAMEAIDHEKAQRLKLAKNISGDTHKQLALSLKKIRANEELSSTDLSPLSDLDLDWLKQRVKELQDGIASGSALTSAVSGIQAELKVRRLKELTVRAEKQSPKVAELFAALTTGAEIKGGILTGMKLEDLRLLTEISEKSASLVKREVSSSSNFNNSLRSIETAFQKKSLAVLVQKVMEASQAATEIMNKIKAAEVVSAAELENLSLPELEAVQAETYRLNLTATKDAKSRDVYRDNLALVSQVYESRIVGEKGSGELGSDSRFKFVASLQEAVGTTLTQKITQLKTANKDDLAAELTVQQDDLGNLMDRSAELASEKTEWIEYFKATPVPKVEGINGRKDWIEAEMKLTEAIYDEIASQDWVVQAKGIADAASNLLMSDTSSMSPIEILTALAIKKAAASDALTIVEPDEDEQFVTVPARSAEAEQEKVAPIRTFEDDDSDDERRKTIENLINK